MAAPNNVEEFLRLIAKSKLVNEQELADYVKQQRVSTTAKPKDLGECLVRDGLLTRFQVKQILQGKYKRFGIGKYQVLEQLGSGGMGNVFLCEDTRDQRPVAIKVLPASLAKTPSALQRFQREARAGAALDHDNIVRTLEVGQEDHLHFLALEYVHGSDLQSLIKKHGPLSPIRAAHYIKQSAVGLQHAHERGLIHRDIKPGNLLLEKTGTIKVLDMGLARFFNDTEDNLTRKFDETCLGTADYFAPEQALDAHTVDIRADIYSLGATFYFLLTGHAPFEDANPVQKLLWHQMKEPKPISDYRNDVPETITAIIQKMMAKDAAKRYQTPAEVAQALAPLTQTAVAPPSEAELPRLSLAAHRIGKAGTNLERRNPSSMEFMLPPMTLPAPSRVSRSQTGQNPRPPLSHINRLPGAPTGKPPIKWKRIGMIAGAVLLVIVSIVFWSALSGSAGQSSPSSHSVVATPPTGGAYLQVTHADTPPKVDLTSAGSMDWAQWGLNVVGDVNQKKGVPSQIAMKLIGAGNAARYDGNPTRFSWSDGNPTATATDTPTGIYVAGLQGGWEITVPADTSARTLKLYVGVYKARANFEAVVSDHAVGIHNDAIENAGGVRNVVFTANYRGSAPGQKLTIHWTFQTNRGAGNITLQAATLSPAPL